MIRIRFLPHFMQKKHNAPRSIDGFIPRPNTQGVVGFGQKKIGPPNFPGVGVTLSAYGNAPGGNHTAPPRPATQVAGLQLPNIDAKNPLAAGRQRGEKKRQGKLRKLHFLRTKKFWKRLSLSILALFILTGGWLGYKVVRNELKIFHGNPLSVFTTTKLRGEDVGRVNILLAGNSSDDPGHQGADLTDSIMIISIDTKNNTAFMLSVPRDLYVNIPGNGYAKINAAYVDGQADNFNESGYFPGGMGQLQQVIQNNFGITLNYYALVDYNAFRDAVNAVGGISVDIKSQDPRGLYDPSEDYVTHGPLVKLTNGVHELDGEQALDLARARGDAYGSYGFPNSDFDRTSNQRLMLLALKAKSTSTGVLANPLKISSLLDAIGNNLTTDFSASEAHRLYDLGNNISANNVQSIGLNDVNGTDLLANYETEDGESALIPAAGIDDFSAIQAYIQQLTSSNPVVREGANVVVLNATDTSGLAASAATTLKNKGVDVTATEDASANQATTTIIDASGGKMPATKQLLTTLYPHATVTTTNPYSSVYAANFIVVLGADQIPATTSTTSTTTTQ